MEKSKKNTKKKRKKEGKNGRMTITKNVGFIRLKIGKKIENRKEKKLG